MREANDEITLSQVLGAVSKRRRVVLAVIVAFALFSVVLSYVVTPTYRAATLLAPSVNEGEGMLTQASMRYLDLAGLGGAGAAAQKRQELLAVLRSREFTYRFLREEGALSELYPELWDDDAGGWLESAGSDTPTMWRAFQYFDGSVRHIFLNEETGLITLSVEWSDPETAAEWANALVERANRHLRDRAVEEADQSLEYLSRELQRTSAGEVRDALYSLVEMEMQHKMLANVREEYGLDVLDPAVPPEERARPNRRLFAVVGLVLGTLAGTALAIFRERRRFAMPEPPRTASGVEGTGQEDVR